MNFNAKTKGREASRSFLDLVFLCGLRIALSQFHGWPQRFWTAVAERSGDADFARMKAAWRFASRRSPKNLVAAKAAR